MSSTVTVQDPKTGEVLELNIRRRKGKTIVQELPPHLHLENASGPRLAHVAKFGRAAMSAFDAGGFLDGVPVVAAVAGEATRGDGIRSRPKQEQRQAYLRSLIPPEVLQQLEHVGDARGKVTLTEPQSPYFEPRVPRTTRQVGELIPPLP
jgi:hypothetical protein